MAQATIRQISELKPIEGADKIELALVDGWQCVVAKDNGYTVGQPIVFIEIDSFVPFSDALGRYDFLKDKNGRMTVYNGVEGARIKTIKLRKQLSQGLTLPVDISNGQMMLPNQQGESQPVNYGDDVSHMLGIQHYEKPVPAQLAGTVRGTFPKFIQKTDQERVQNLLGTLQDYVSEEFEVTIKLDGSSMTVYRKDSDFGVCSRNMNLKEDENNSFWKVARELRLIDRLQNVNVNLALQGELMGPGVQGNYDDLAQLDFYLFDIYNIDEQRYLLPDERIEMLDQIDPGVAIRHVPFTQYGPTYRRLSEFADDRGNILDSLLTFANGESLNRAKKREGLVFKHRKSEFSFKVINNEFLLLKGE